MAGSTEQKAIGFPTFGGLRLDQSLDEVGANASIYEHDIERDGSVGRFRSRDGFQKLNASAGTGEYKGLWPHSALRLLAIRRISATEVKCVALDKEGAVKTESAALATTEAPSTFASIGTPGGTFTYLRTNVSTQKVVRFNGTAFSEPTCNIENVTETGETEKKEAKEFPRGRHMVGWPDAGNVLVVANTAETGGPNAAKSSASHVWFSRAMPAAEATPVAFEESAFLALGAGDGEEITGLCVFASQLYVFKETRFWVVSPPSTNERGQPVFSFREVSLGQGSHIKQVLTEKLKETSDRICWASQDGVFFTTTDGVYQTSGGQPSKISQQLKPLEETVPFEGPMAEFLNGSTESFRWPATGITVLGRKLFVKRYEFIFVFDLNVGEWTCWKMPSVSMAIWTGLTGGGAEAVEKTPGTAEDDSGTGSFAWSNVNNIKVEDGSCATAKRVAGNPEATTHYLKATNFGFAIPAGSTIIGIRAAVRRKFLFGGVVTSPPGKNGMEDNRARIVKGGVIKEAERAIAGQWPTTFATATYGGEEDQFGESWTVADINSAGFGFALSAYVGHVLEGEIVPEVDSVRMTVYYLTAESSSGVRPRLFCSQSKTVFWNGPTAIEEATFPGWAWQSGLYDLGSEDEKELVKAKLWGAGTIKVATSKDFKAIQARKTFTMGEDTTQKSQNISDKATLFSHRFEGSGKASVQRFVRYLRTTATSGSQSDPS
jgi:hypothetical protein